MKSIKKLIEIMNLELGKFLITKNGYPLPQGNELIAWNSVHEVNKATKKEA